MKTTKAEAGKAMAGKPLNVRVGPFKAIFTRYLGPGNVRGARIKAYDGDGNSVTIGYDHAASRDVVYAQAARALCEKLGWGGELVGGWMEGGYAFVFVDGGARLEALQDALESLKRLPSVDGAYRVTCIQQAERAIARAEGGVQ